MARPLYAVPCQVTNRRLTLTSSNGFPIARVLPVPSGVPLRIAAAAPATNLSLFSVPSPALGRGASPQNDPVYDIFLIYNGQDVRHQVYESMPILQLVREAGARFRLDWTQIILMLFSMTPVTLDRNGLISGPPRVGENARVFVFVINASVENGQAVVDTYNRTPQASLGGQSPHDLVHNRGVQARPFFPYAPGPLAFGLENPNPPLQVNLPPASTLVSSKLLSAFKLPIFDGAPRHWKNWDRSLQRFLGLHQLDYVLSDDFLQFLPHPDAVNANKIVYFLIEEAVAVGTLAAKYVRQAPRWNGHEAYILLYNRFVFSGPQTAAVLLAELCNTSGFSAMKRPPNFVCGWWSYWRSLKRCQDLLQFA